MPSSSITDYLPPGRPSAPRRRPDAAPSSPSAPPRPKPRPTAGSSALSKSQPSAQAPAPAPAFAPSSTPDARQRRPQQAATGSRTSASASLPDSVLGSSQNPISLLSPVMASTVLPASAASPSRPALSQSSHAGLGDANDRNVDLQDDERSRATTDSPDPPSPSEIIAAYRAKSSIPATSQQPASGPASDVQQSRGGGPTGSQPSTSSNAAASRPPNLNVTNPLQQLRASGPTATQQPVRGIPTTSQQAGSSFHTASQQQGSSSVPATFSQQQRCLSNSNTSPAQPSSSSATVSQRKSRPSAPAISPQPSSQRAERAQQGQQARASPSSFHSEASASASASLCSLFDSPRQSPAAGDTIMHETPPSSPLGPAATQPAGETSATSPPAQRTSSDAQRARRTSATTASVSAAPPSASSAQAKAGSGVGRTPSRCTDSPSASSSIEPDLRLSSANGNSGALGASTGPLTQSAQAYRPGTKPGQWPASDIKLLCTLVQRQGPFWKQLEPLFNASSISTHWRSRSSLRHQWIALTRRAERTPQITAAMQAAATFENAGAGAPLPRKNGWTKAELEVLHDGVAQGKGLTAIYSDFVAKFTEAQRTLRAVQDKLQQVTKAAERGIDEEEEEEESEDDDDDSDSDLQEAGGHDGNSEDVGMTSATDLPAPQGPAEGSGGNQQPWSSGQAVRNRSFSVTTMQRAAAAAHSLGYGRTVSRHRRGGERTSTASPTSPRKRKRGRQQNVREGEDNDQSEAERQGEGDEVAMSDLLATDEVMSTQSGRQLLPSNDAIEAPQTGTVDAGNPPIAQGSSAEMQRQLPSQASPSQHVAFSTAAGPITTAQEVPSRLVWDGNEVRAKGCVPGVEVLVFGRGSAVMTTPGSATAAMLPLVESPIFHFKILAHRQVQQVTMPLNTMVSVVPRVRDSQAAVAGTISGISLEWRFAGPEGLTVVLEC